MRDEHKPKRDQSEPVETAHEVEVTITFYQISVVAQMVETHPQTLRMYERMGLIEPQRTPNNIRLYTDDDVERVRRIQHLTQDLGVNLAGVEVVFKLLQEIEKLMSEQNGDAKTGSSSPEQEQKRA